MASEDEDYLEYEPWWVKKIWRDTKLKGEGDQRKFAFAFNVASAFSHPLRTERWYDGIIVAWCSWQMKRHYNPKWDQRDGA